MSNSYITDIVVVSGKDKCPPGYKIVNVTVGGHEADLFEGSLAKRGERYICFAQQPGSSTVITDVNIVRDKDSIPIGFTAIKNCKNDTNEKALRKHLLCIRPGQLHTAQSCVVNILMIKQSKGEMTPQNCYTVSNDVNGLHVCYQVMPTTCFRQPQVQVYQQQRNMQYRPPTIQPSYPVPAAPYYNPPQNTARYGMPITTTPQTRAPQSDLTRQHSIHKLTSALQGIQFQVNPKYEMIWKSSYVTTKTAKICSTEDIEKKYGYNFETEQKLLSSR